MDVILKTNQMDTPEEQRSPKGLGKFYFFFCQFVVLVVYE